MNFSKLKTMASCMPLATQVQSINRSSEKREEAESNMRKPAARFSFAFAVEDSGTGHTPPGSRLVKSLGFGMQGWVKGLGFRMQGLVKALGFGMQRQ